MKIPNGPAPKYQIWAERIRKQIRSGQLRPGERLPSFSQMKQSGFSQATLDRALALLENEGLIIRREKVGVFIAEENTLNLPQINEHSAQDLMAGSQDEIASDPSPGRTSGLVGIPGMNFASRHHFNYDAIFLEGILQTLRSGEKQIVLLDTDSPTGWDRVEGVVMINESAIGRYLPEGIPWVCCLNAVSDAPSYMPDDSSGARMLAQHLVDLGHRRIACLMEISPPLRRNRLNSPVGLRIEAWENVLSENGIARNPKWKRNLFAPLDPLPNYRRSAYHVMKRWLQEDWHELGCTAVMAQNDMAAIGAIEALQEAGLRVPEDVSVTGFDGVEPSWPRIPEITTVRVPLEKVGFDAANALLKLMKGETVEPKLHLYPVELMVRESTASPADR